jgi:hypothetical protein
MRLWKISCRSKGRLVDAPGRVRELGNSGVPIPNLRSGAATSLRLLRGRHTDGRPPDSADCYTVDEVVQTEPENSFLLKKSHEAPRKPQCVH